MSYQDQYYAALSNPFSNAGGLDWLQYAMAPYGASPLPSAPMGGINASYLNAAGFDPNFYPDQGAGLQQATLVNDGRQSNRAAPPRRRNSDLLDRLTPEEKERLEAYYRGRFESDDELSPREQLARAIMQQAAGEGPVPGWGGFAARVIKGLIAGIYARKLKEKRELAELEKRYPGKSGSAASDPEPISGGGPGDPSAETARDAARRAANTGAAASGTGYMLSQWANRYPSPLDKDGSMVIRPPENGGSGRGVIPVNAGTADFGGAAEAVPVNDSWDGFGGGEAPSMDDKLKRFKAFAGLFDNDDNPFLSNFLKFI